MNWLIYYDLWSVKVFVERSTSEAYFKGAATIDFFMYSFRRFSLKLLLTYLLTSLRIVLPVLVILLIFWICRGSAVCFVLVSRSWCRYPHVDWLDINRFRRAVHDNTWTQQSHLHTAAFLIRYRVGVGSFFFLTAQSFWTSGSGKVKSCFRSPRFDRIERCLGAGLARSGAGLAGQLTADWLPRMFSDPTE